MWHLNEAFIDGRFVPVRGTDTLTIHSPATARPLGRVTLGNREDGRLAVEAAARAQRTFGQSGVGERITLLRRLEAAVRERGDAIREATIDEYGGPVARARWVADYAADCFAGAARLLERYAFERSVGTARLRQEPVGVAVLIAPWNSAAGSIASKLSSALAAGCATVIKPSEFSPQQARVMTEAIAAADLPPGLVNVVIGHGHELGDEISTHPAVRKLSFTGSTATGRLIARAGIETMKRVSLALSGKSATLLMPDADLDQAVPLAVAAAFMNSGQACVAGTRLLIPRSRRDAVLERLRERVTALRVGDPRDPATDIGPLLHAAQFERIQRFIRLGLEQGATLVAGGEGRPDGLPGALHDGWFVRPTVFADVEPRMAIASEEIFGPVLAVLSYDDSGPDADERALELANDSAYGLQAYVLTGDLERGRRLAARLEAGSVLINRVAPDLDAPFGGVKLSGIGREFGEAGLEAFLETKTIVTG